MSNLKLTPQDRQSIDFAEEERLKSLNAEFGAVVHKNEKGYVSLNSWQKWHTINTEILTAEFNTKKLKNFTKEDWKLVCQKDGLYLIFASVIVERTDTSASNTNFHIRKNGGYLCESCCRGQLSGKKTPMSLMTMQYLVKGDYINVSTTSDNSGCVGEIQDPQVVIMEV